MGRARRLRPPSTEALFGLTIALFGFRLGAHSIGDNSMFAHLRTGVDMVRGAGIPRQDPYSFTAQGHSWVVQSWLAEWTYGALHELGGLRLVILEQAVLMAVLAWVIVRLAAAGTPLRTALAGSIAVGAGAGYWTQRPLLFGLLALALTVLVVERRWNPWWLVPIAWIWVNTHGSFPLAVAYLGARIVGEYLDDRRVESWRYAGAFAVGLAVSAINPLGPKLLAFAVTIGDKRDVFREVTEWRSPDFQKADGLWALVFLTAALLILMTHRVRWRHALPAAGFVALGLIAMRNVSPAAIVLAPALGAALRPATPRSGAADGARDGTVNTAFLAVLAVAFVIFGVAGVSGDPLDLRDYPVAAARYMEREGLFESTHRVAHNDVIGDYLILRNGRRGRVFADDRFDMYPPEVSNDVSTLIKGGAKALDVLDRWRIDTVLWEKDAPLVGIMEATGDWRVVATRGGWAVLRRR